MTELAKSLHDRLVAAATARQSGRLDEELRQLESALRLAPNHPQVLNARGMRALAERDARLAHDLFAKAAAHDPKEPALWMNVATANTLTVPPNSSVPFQVGTQVAVRQYGAGVTTLTAGAGVTIRSRGGPRYEAVNDSNITEFGIFKTVIPAQE